MDPSLPNHHSTTVSLQKPSDLPILHLHSAPKNVCSCSKCRCLRLHCSCFVNGLICSPECQCKGCLNNHFHEAERNFVMHYTSIISNDAFQPRFINPAEDLQQVVNRRGCRCQKSRCQTRYCECFKNGIACGPMCICINCLIKNPESTQMDTVKTKLKIGKKKLKLIIPGAGKKAFSSNEGQDEIMVVDARHSLKKST